MLLNDMQITKLAMEQKMIEPFIPKSIKESTYKDMERNKHIHPSRIPFTSKKVISYGVSSFGYDIRVRDVFKVFTNVFNGVIDPKDFNESNFVEVCSKPDEDFIVIPPNSFALAESVETFKMPKDILGVVYGKSTYARCGIITNVTPLEPEWEGTVTLEISNTTSLPAKVYINEGLCQVLFMQGEQPSTTYADRNGKYQKQSGITLPKV